jgi:hypothetical protein
VAERHAALHAAGSLNLDSLIGHGISDVAPVGHSLLERTIRGNLTVELLETGDLTHRSHVLRGT